MHVRRTPRPSAHLATPPPRTSARGAPVARGGSPRTFHQPDKNLYVHLLGHLRKKALLPVVIFTFSKKRCEENAGTLTNADLCTAVEKSEIHVAIEKALSRLKGSDRHLPQIRRMRDLLSRGIGVHHGGLLPIVKEGVNMPAKSVVFSHIRKHDGRSFRDILPGEYTQMAGRAGRRGLDPTGTVIIVANDELPEQGILHNMILGTPTKLQSQFRLTYKHDPELAQGGTTLRVEEMIKRSFSENASQKLLPDNQKKVIETEKKLSSMPLLSCDICSSDIEAYYDTSFNIVEMNQRLLTMAAATPHGSKLLSSGRGRGLEGWGESEQAHCQMIIANPSSLQHYKWNIGVLLKQAPNALATSFGGEKVKLYFVLAMVSPETRMGKTDVDGQSLPPRWPPRPESLLVDEPTYDLTPIPLTSIAMVSNRSIKTEWIVEKHRISYMNDAMRSLQGVLGEWLQQGSIPEVDWNRLRALDFQELLRTRNELVPRLNTFACISCPEFEEHYTFMHAKKVLEANIAELKMAISDQNLELHPRLRTAYRSAEGVEVHR
ncbi:hypothetical protein NUW54_g9269 [Trametes sanguinea]|uniref:Uncharacterized protein n=1 Tax=Trametes sanguinea TaxID=158606 RepID=A0ACC1P8R7_9APHY|nr:hypothetical protein NUW54_g9269 [Trametes sanguinea]